MKRKVFLALLAAGFISCQKEKPTELTILEGHITNTEGGSFVLSSLKGYEHTINVKDDGTFKDTLDIEPGMFYGKFQKTGIQLYLDKATHVKISGDGSDFSSTIKFEGDYADADNLFAQKMKTKDSIHDEMRSLYALDEKAFIEHVEKIKHSFLKRLEGVNSLSDRVKNLEKKSIGYLIQGLYNDYPLYYSYSSDNRNYTPSEDFKKYLAVTDFDSSEDFFYSQDYNIQAFIGVMRKAGKLKEDSKSLSQDDAQFKVLAEFKNDSIRESLLARFAQMSIPFMREGRKEYFQKYMAMSKDKNLQKKVAKVLESLAKLESGKPSPKFNNYQNFKGGTTSLDDLKGKYVYIDVWATWCGPCKAEIPFLKVIEEKYHDKNIEFVSISVDNKQDTQKWKDMIAEKKMGGVQLLANDAFNSQFVRDYQINGIPQFILLDPDGNIVKSQAPRPSEEGLVTLLNSLNL